MVIGFPPVEGVAAGNSKPSNLRLTCLQCSPKNPEGRSLHPRAQISPLSIFGWRLAGLHAAVVPERPNLIENSHTPGRDP